MNVEVIFWIIIIIIIFDYLLDQILDYLNYKSIQEKVPPQLQGIYDDDKYEESQRYSKENMVFSFFTSTFSFIIILLLLFGFGFAFLDDYVRSITPNDYLRTILFFGIFGLAMDIISIPFQLYGTFVLENRFGFNKTTPLIFATDKVKSWFLSAIIAGGLLLFVMWAWKETGPWFWIIVMGGMSIFMIFMTMFYSRIIVPIFNKQTPLEDGSLKVSINEFANKAQFKIDNIFVIDGSKRSTKANAYFTGLGSKKRIVLYDTLINDLSNEEIVAVLAHEVGHNKLKHVITGLIISMLQSGLMLVLLYFALGSPDLSLAMGATDASFYMGVLAFGLLFSPISRILGIFSNIISRRNEYQADRFASKYGLAKHLVSGLIKLSVANLSNLTPHWLYVAINYSHPTLLQRKKALEDLK
ncbi:MAG: M48 family metallopeptidase [Lentimicrobiaceae bacterium]|jgi:STE24 endopeptidase|nr:M48 family metallopeptidase [Lentimicrobiaceae bacterium]MCP4911232.1 M48 family metallopeptidase [Bacteroidota bacterium]MBT3453943.1 M48 family metallopeptidase [Lentimicrobiaceae bacterium]MBT3818554.1 M48 family metallopeptidase [Lentimicrobiaceae bacterium]MBT4191117.1 M48 family metallopeptidase [Lentimicrobiaceae bacterium]